MHVNKIQCDSNLKLEEWSVQAISSLSANLCICPFLESGARLAKF